MGRTLDEMIELLPADQQAEIAQRAATLRAEELSLRDLRKALRLTQVDVARRLNKGQEVVSRLEKRPDMMLSTLQGYVESLGGQLELVCRFAQRAPVRIKAGASVKKVSKRTTTRRAAAA